MKRTGALFIVLALVLAGLGAGCVQREMGAQLCLDLDGLGDALDTLEDTGTLSSVQDIRNARDQVWSAMENVRNSAVQVPGVRIDGLDAAYGDLDRAVQDLPDDMNVVGAVETIRPQIQALRDEQQSLSADLNCTGW
ncbi:hypothetical protein F8E02_12385 [Methanoculleus sp. Wushi-C6]|uniref:Uncharacterized protein n=1 Tax=Methanoculleus caldifontis TaxID=2651577 RepID=A0ABU3X3Z0_9EURY|nr:hypothetical protein [Methanoculleus sp. Wushi-C6]MDV2482775.1 hypothetical protein [Methanoculleus sp. Wushi-C6]